MGELFLKHQCFMLFVLECVCVQSQPGSISLSLFHSAEGKLISTVWEDRHHPPLCPQHVPCLSLSLNNPSPFTPPSEEEDLDPPFLPSSSLILSQLEAAKRNRNAEYSMLTFLTIRSYHKDVELTSVNMLNCLYVSLACLSCMYNNV